MLGASPAPLQMLGRQPVPPNQGLRTVGTHGSSRLVGCNVSSQCRWHLIVQILWWGHRSLQEVQGEHPSWAGLVLVLGTLGR